MIYLLLYCTLALAILELITDVSALGNASSKVTRHGRNYERSLQNPSQKYVAEAFECDNNYNPITSGAPKTVGSTIQICVQPVALTLARGVVMRSINSFSFQAVLSVTQAVTQDAVIPDGKEAPGTIVDCVPGDKVCVLQTKLEDQLFASSSKVTGQGEVFLQFQSSLAAQNSSARHLRSRRAQGQNSDPSFAGTWNVSLTFDVAAGVGSAGKKSVKQWWAGLPLVIQMGFILGVLALSIIFICCLFYCCYRAFHDKGDEAMFEDGKVPKNVEVGYDPYFNKKPSRGPPPHHPYPPPHPSYPPPRRSYPPSRPSYPPPRPSYAPPPTRRPVEPNPSFDNSGDSFGQDDDYDDDDHQNIPMLKDGSYPDEPQKLNAKPGPPPKRTQPSQRNNNREPRPVGNKGRNQRPLDEDPPLESSNSIPKSQHKKGKGKTRGIPNGETQNHNPSTNDKDDSQVPNVKPKNKKTNGRPDPVDDSSEKGSAEASVSSEESSLDEDEWEADLEPASRSAMPSNKSKASSRSVTSEEDAESDEESWAEATVESVEFEERVRPTTKRRPPKSNRSILSASSTCSTISEDSSVEFEEVVRRPKRGSTPKSNRSIESSASSVESSLLDAARFEEVVRRPKNPVPRSERSLDDDESTVEFQEVDRRARKPVPKSDRSLDDDESTVEFQEVDRRARKPITKSDRSLDDDESTVEFQEVARRPRRPAPKSDRSLDDDESTVEFQEVDRRTRKPIPKSDRSLGWPI